MFFATDYTIICDSCPW